MYFKIVLTLMISVKPREWMSARIKSRFNFTSFFCKTKAMILVFSSHIKNWEGPGDCEKKFN